LSADWYIGKAGRTWLKEKIEVFYINLSDKSVMDIALWVVEKAHKFLKVLYAANKNFFGWASLLVCSFWAILRLISYTVLFSKGEAFLISSGVIGKHPFIEEHQFLAKALLDSDKIYWVILYAGLYALLIWVSAGITGSLIGYVLKKKEAWRLILAVPIDFFATILVLFISFFLNIMFALFAFVLFYPKEYLDQRDYIHEVFAHFTIADMSGPIIYPSIIYSGMFIFLTIILIFGRALLMFLTQFFLASSESESTLLRQVGIGIGVVVTIVIASGKLFSSS
tara:strand:+ start:463 stop:1305 length:843 start_codon:yes stop_codon:yes gene_type:complete